MCVAGVQKNKSWGWWKWRRKHRKWIKRGRDRPREKVSAFRQEGWAETMFGQTAVSRKNTVPSLAVTLDGIISGGNEGGIKSYTPPKLSDTRSCMTDSWSPCSVVCALSRSIPQTAFPISFCYMFVLFYQFWFDSLAQKAGRVISVVLRLKGTTL